MRPHARSPFLPATPEQFGKQEPGSNREIKAFARVHYNATFPLFSKTDVNGRRASPVF